MSVLSTMLTNYRTLLAAAPASLVNLPATFEEDDLPASKNHKVFQLTIGGFLVVRDLFGGGTMEFEGAVRLEIRWDPELDFEAIHNTIADDFTNASAVMLKTSNRPSGVQRVWLENGGDVAKMGKNQVGVISIWGVIWRETLDTT